MRHKREARSTVTLAVLAGFAAAAAAPAQETARVTVQGGGCARTPAAAILAAKGVKGALLLSQVEGYRVRAVNWDAVLRRSWAVIENCAHPELPTTAMVTDLPPDRAPAPSPGGFAEVLSKSETIVRANAVVAVVHAGELVRLWRNEPNAHIELMAASEENGAVGARIRVRLVRPNETNGQSVPVQYLAGVVRGPADVEIEP